MTNRSEGRYKWSQRQFLTCLVALVLLTIGAGIARAADKVIESTYSPQDEALQTDPHSVFWKSAGHVYAERDAFGKAVPGYRSEIRSRWTEKNLYLLFICPYEQLYLKPSPDPGRETNQLWNWDVAEAFIGSDFQNIKHYKEFELSPQPERVDLIIQLEKPHHEDGSTWNSGFQVSARVGESAH